MSRPRFKISYVWWPRRLARRLPSTDALEFNGFEFIGWVWLQQARLVNNISHGWVAFLDEQTPEKLKTCPCCNKPLKE